MWALLLLWGKDICDGWDDWRSIVKLAGAVKVRKLTTINNKVNKSSHEKNFVQLRKLRKKEM